MSKQQDDCEHEYGKIWTISNAPLYKCIKCGLLKKDDIVTTYEYVSDDMQRELDKMDNKNKGK